MSETRTFTASDVRTAVAVAVKRDRARISAILTAPEAACRAAMALTMATTTDLSVDQVKAALTRASSVTAPAAARTGSGVPMQLPATPNPPRLPRADTPNPPALTAPHVADASAAGMWDKVLSRRFKKAGVP